MAEVQSDNHGAWLNFAPCCMSEQDWKVAAKTPEAVLSHRSCPWGGHLIKLESRSVFIQEAPEDPCDVMVRPEVQAMFEGDAEVSLDCHETYSPGDALIQRRNSMWLIRFTSVLFGHCLGHSSFANCVFNKMTVLSRHRLHKDFPEPGDSSYFAFEGVWILRRLPDSHSCFRSVFVFSTPEDKWASWASSLFPAYAIMFHRGVDRVLNGPMFKELRPIDAKLYSVLALKSFNRGHPLVPQGSESDPSADTVTVSAGEHLGLVSWTCFNPHRKFFLAEYLQSFMAALGLELKTFKVMDGRKLVKYQCVVVRQEWNQVRALFFEAFKVQKAAYRRANGGTSNPSLVEDVAPHFVSCDFTYNRCSQVIKTVVRKTFLELDEASESQLKRSISTGEMPYEVSVL